MAIVRPEGPYILRAKEWRPRGIGLTGCQQVTLKDFTIRDAAQWTIHLTGCEDVLCQSLRILNRTDIPTTASTPTAASVYALSAATSRPVTTALCSNARKIFHSMVIAKMLSSRAVLDFHQCGLKNRYRERR